MTGALRVVLTTHQFLPDFAAGTEQIVLGTARELRRRGHLVTIVTGHPGDRAMEDADRFDSYVYDGFEVVRFHHAEAPMGGQRNPAEAEYFNRLFHDFFRDWLVARRPDIVHFHHLGRLSAAAIAACRDCAVPSLFTATDFWLICPTHQLRLPDGSMCAGPSAGAANCVRHMTMLTRPRPVSAALGLMPESVLTRAVGAVASGLAVLGANRELAVFHAIINRKPVLLDAARALARVIVPSRTMQQAMLAHGIPRDRLVLLPYGLDLDRIRRSTDRGGEPALRVVFVGSVLEHKGPDVLLRAVRRLPPDVRVQVAIHGPADPDAPYTRRIRSLAGRDGRISLCGSFDNDGVGDVLSAADVVVCPSIWYENTPLVIYEALAAGVPVVATNLPGMSEAVVHGQNGLLFERGDTKALAGHLATLAADREQVRRLARGTRPPLSRAEHADRLEAVYADILAADRLCSATQPPRERASTRPGRVAAPDLVAEE